MSNLSLYYALGSATNSIQTFDILGLVAPFQDAYNPYSVEIQAQDGLIYGYGIATTTLRWGFISQADRNLLKSYCSNKSAIVYIRIRDDDWTWVYCQAVMVWQPENPPSNGFIIDFSVAFRILQNYGVNPP